MPCFPSHEIKCVFQVCFRVDFQVRSPSPCGWVVKLACKRACPYAGGLSSSPMHPHACSALGVCVTCSSHDARCWCHMQFCPRIGCVCHVCFRVDVQARLRVGCQARLRVGCQARQMRATLRAQPTPETPPLGDFFSHKESQTLRNSEADGLPANGKPDGLVSIAKKLITRSRWRVDSWCFFKSAIRGVSLASLQAMHPTPSPFQ